MNGQVVRAAISILFLFWANLLAAQDFSGLARLDQGASTIRDDRGGILVDLTLSQGVPYRIFTLDDPRRAVFDFREVDWSGVDRAALLNTRAVASLAMGGLRPGWSRLVLALEAPMVLNRSALRVDPDTGKARLTARFVRADADRFAASAGAPPDIGWPSLPPADVPRRRNRPADAPLLVVLDPGHGGIDPGAEHGGVVEKDLMLTFAREVKDALVRAGAEVVLTRDDDSFVSLERRVTIAHQLGADLFVSLHADALARGRAHGTTIHTLAASASDEASEKLAERHDRGDLLAGVDLSGKDDVVTGVLLDLARMETQPRADRLARALVLAIRRSGLPLNTRPRRSASYSVLKAADIPSVLIEVGFLSSERDRENLTDPAFRARVAGAVRDAVLAWRLADRATAPLVRQ
ncbi:N-acetylmuramoyl-L-alanine amidase [Pseudooceanicola aestuarii]|uniref:N-acetylmuramoyl-L-alanine amidase n=1 Tax=Pseudooceanicola aestuarii TaxID=2697319 RepID=UPI0013D42EA4|nr:N-acetylmuramoyl-L-alanine amidase [Pseudooceanicola aestuarii]